VLNTKFPEIGELLLHRLLKQWVRAYTRNDKPIILAVSKFIAHLVNQQVQPVVEPVHSVRSFLRS
jgi:pre-mRNA-splicing factor CWC22